MKTIKLAVIGAGSSYTPELLDGLLRRSQSLPLTELRLMDIDERKLRIAGGMASRMFRKAGYETKLILTTELDEALDAADYVCAQIRVGGLTARINDEKLPLKHGLIGQETTGIGGMMNALRTIPELERITQRMERLCSQATLINFSNPSGLVAEALAKRTTIRFIGLCNGPINMIRSVKSQLTPEPQSFDFDFVGLNHLCWLTAVYADGLDRLPELLAKGGQAAKLRNIDGIDYDAKLLAAVPYLPIAYLNYYYFHDRELSKMVQAPKSRGELCLEIEEELLTAYQDEKLAEKPAALAKRGGSLYSEAAVSLIEAMVCDEGSVQVLDVPNAGAYDFMEADDVVEVKCHVTARGALPLPLRGFSHPVVIGLMKAVKAYEKLTAKAALEGDRAAALGALLVHPLIGDYDKAVAAFDEMLEANRVYLPRFF